MPSAQAYTVDTADATLYYYSVHFIWRLVTIFFDLYFFASLKCKFMYNSQKKNLHQGRYLHLKNVP